MNNRLDSREALITHKKIISNNKFLKLVYKDFYKKIALNISSKPVVEIGSGAGFIKKVMTNVTTTDVVEGYGIDRIASAEKMPFKSNSIGSIVMLNTFHHIKNPTKALCEFSRCLKPNGKIIMIEPWPTLFSTFIYRNFHHEEFNLSANWKIKGKGRMSDANGALPWIVFKRDAKKFNKLYPNLKIEACNPHTPFKYLVSGGLSHSQYMPNFLYPLLSLFELIITPMNNYLAMFAIIVISKTDIHTTHD
jgi:SAM-dependent methyltransferase